MSLNVYVVYKNTVSMTKVIEGVGGKRKGFSIERLKPYYIFIYFLKQGGFFDLRAYNELKLI